SRIAINAAMDTQRLRKRRPADPYPELEDDSWQPPADASADPVNTSLTAERHRALNQALAQVTDDQRTAIVLYDVDGYDHADDATRAAARAQIATCEDCAALFADLRAISENLTALPRTLPVARDFRISPERAATLRPRGWRRLLGGFGRGPSLRPLASALTT